MQGGLRTKTLKNIRLNEEVENEKIILNKPRKNIDVKILEEQNKNQYKKGEVNVMIFGIYSKYYLSVQKNEARSMIIEKITIVINFHDI